MPAIVISEPEEEVRGTPVHATCITGLCSVRCEEANLTKALPDSRKGVFKASFELCMGEQEGVRLPPELQGVSTQALEVDPTAVRASWTPFKGSAQPDRKGGCMRRNTSVSGLYNLQEPLLDV